VLYAGVMIDRGGAPWLLEYNCRFGDPETQPIMARMRGDLGAVLLGCARGELPAGALAWDPRACVCVVVAAAVIPTRSAPAIRSGWHRAGRRRVPCRHRARRAGPARHRGGRVLA